MENQATKKELAAKQSSFVDNLFVKGDSVKNFLNNMALTFALQQRAADAAFVENNPSCDMCGSTRIVSTYEGVLDDEVADKCLSCNHVMH